MPEILALTRYGSFAASTRQRFLQFEPALAEAGFTLSLSCLFDDGDTASINRGGAVGIAGAMSAFASRIAALLAKRQADILWVQYELFPFLPAVFERIAFLGSRPVVVDYDDPFFHRYNLHRRSVVRRLLGDKMKPLVESAVGVVAGNEYLAGHLRLWNRNVTIIPTVVDTSHYVPDHSRSLRRPTIGWIGSPSTWAAYVRPYLGLIRSLCASTGARFLAVGTGEIEQNLFDGFEFRSWVEEREVSDIHDMDIGIMPLPDDEWARGKCGYKLIQYMACGLPTVASPVGVNSTIVEDGVSGFLASDDGEWRTALERLVSDPKLRRRMGTAGRDRVVSDYSLESQAPRLVEVMKRAIKPRESP